LLCFVPSYLLSGLIRRGTALVALLKALFAKLDLKAETNFAPGHGFHRDYNPDKSCPGKLITKELVLSWLTQ